MTRFEFFIENKDVLDVLFDNGCAPADYKYVGLMVEYERMMAEGNKRYSVMYYLSEKYGMLIRNVYRVVKRFNEQMV